MTRPLSHDVGVSFGFRRRGRPTTGPVHEVRVADALWDKLRAEAKDESVAVAEMLRRILAERYGT